MTSLILAAAISGFWIAPDSPRDPPEEPQPFWILRPTGFDEIERLVSNRYH